jgi:amidase
MIGELQLTGIDRVKMNGYIDWMRSCYYITVTSHPSISVPAGFTAEGLPVGLQIVGRHHDDWGVLQIAHAFEQERGALLPHREPHAKHPGVAFGAQPG